MLRVEASNLPIPRSTPRPRRLLPHPPSVKRRDATAARHELLPPTDAAGAVDLVQTPAPPATSERWSVRLELKDDDIAKLYGQGMTRGAVVWKKGMVEWRPLLVTPELTTLLRRTRTTLSPAPAEVSSSPLAAEELTLPRPARLPSDMAPPIGALPPPNPPPLASQYPDKPRFTTVAPTASDVEREPAAPRRRVELAAVAVAAFALAWITHGRLSSQGEADARTAASLVAATPKAPVACEPASPPPGALAPTATPVSSIPTVAVSDLPLAGGRGSRSASGGVTTGGSHGSAGRAAAPSRSASASAPTRAELMGALGQVARAASSCGERGGPVRVVMSFAGSGVARSIQVSGSGLPAQTRSCIIGAASRARVPAFSGDPVTVSKTL